MTDLTVTLIQAELQWEAPAHNRDRFAAKIASLDHPTDLIVLPEMFTTGFSMNAAQLAETMDGPTVQWMHQIASQTQAAITGSLIIQVGEQYFNRLVFMRPDGEISTYNKRHCFSLAQEHLTYTPGRQREPIVWRNWKIMPQICYDLRFPVWSRNNLDYDLLLYVANFPEKRQYAWQHLLIARAIENQCYTIGVNCVGVDGHQIAYAGGSAIHDYLGTVLYRVSHAEDVFTLTLAAAPQKQFRQNFPFLADQDPFSVA